MNGFGKWRICGENGGSLVFEVIWAGSTKPSRRWRSLVTSLLIHEKSGEMRIFFSTKFPRLEVNSIGFSGWKFHQSLINFPPVSFLPFGSIWYPYPWTHLVSLPLNILELTDSTSWALMWLLSCGRFRPLQFPALRNATSSETQMHRGWSWCPTLKPGKCWSRIAGSSTSSRRVVHILGGWWPIHTLISWGCPQSCRGWGVMGSEPHGLGVHQPMTVLWRWVEKLGTAPKAWPGFSLFWGFALYFLLHHSNCRT